MMIKDAIISITGAGGGLGAAMARQLAADGARLALIDHDMGQVEPLHRELGDERCLVLPCDVTRENQVDGAFAAITEHFGRLDALVNNAGITRDAMLLKYQEGEPVSRMSLEQWRDVVDVNLTGVFLCGRAAAEQMARGGRGGHIINISSISRAGNIGQSNYAAAKAGVAALAVTWARELARYGIRANAISPGFIGTEMVRGIKPEIIDKLQGMIPVGRIGEPDEIAHTVKFLLENEFINGRNIEIDGGMRL